MDQPSKQVILVTGANSFIGRHIVSEALQRGHYIRGVVRSQVSAITMRAAFRQFSSRLSMCVVQDMTTAGSYESTFRNSEPAITAVVHTASPFNFALEDNKRDVLDPAIDMVVALLQATRQFGPDVCRIVQTSSAAAIIDPAFGNRPGYRYTERDWNPTTYEQAAAADPVTAYLASKALAEKAMWEWANTNNPSFSVVSINPAWVFGPYIGGMQSLSNVSQSTKVLTQLLDAHDIPPPDFAGFADVRVVAKAHLEAVERPAAAGQRFLVSSHFDYQSAADALRAEFPNVRHRVPEGSPGNGTGIQYYIFDGRKTEELLGISYIPLAESVRDTFVQVLAAETPRVNGMVNGHESELTLSL